MPRGPRRIAAVRAIQARSSECPSRWWTVVGCVGVLVAAPAAVAQETAIDLGNALRNLSEQQDRLPLVPPPAPASSSASTVSGEPFVLLGVVIAAERRLALLQPARATDAAQLVALGSSFEDHRLIDVQQDRVTLEARGGERILVRLASGHDARGAAPSTVAASPVKPDGAAPFDERARQAKEERQRQIDESTARDKARALAERSVSGTAPAGPMNH